MAHPLFLRRPKMSRNRPLAPFTDLSDVRGRFIFLSSVITGHSVYLTAPAVIPLIKYLDIIRYIKSIGTMAMLRPVNISAQSVEY